MTLGEIAYNAYCKSHGGSSPRFNELIPELKTAWDESAKAVVEECLTMLNKARTEQPK